MSRLTYRTDDGRWGVKGVEMSELSGVLYGALCKLRDYENTELSPTAVEYLRDEIRVGTMVGGYKVIGCCNGYCVGENKATFMPYAVWKLDGDGHSVCDGKHFRTRDEAGMYFTQNAWEWGTEEGGQHAG